MKRMGRMLGVVSCFALFAVLLLWRPLLAGEVFFWGTPLLQFVPWQRMAAEMWRSGYVPLWNPLVGCGAPLAANYQTGAFYPLNVLYLLLPAEVALSWTTALHLVLAGWGMYRWGRTVGLNRLPALLGGLTLEGSGFLVSRVALFPSMAFTFPWIGVWLWRAEALMQHRSVRSAAWLGLVLGLGFLAGHAQMAFYGGVLLAVYLIFRTLCQVRDRAGGTLPGVSHILPLWLLILGAVAAGVGLAAVQLLPTAALMSSSQRSAGAGYDFAMTYSLWPWRAITFWAPDFFGNPSRGDYWGYPNYWEGAGYVGVLPLLLAVEAVLARERRKAGRIWFWVSVAAITLLLSLGNNTPVFPFLFRHVLTFDLFQAPARWLALVTVALAALTAWGAQRWPVGHRGRRLGLLGSVVGLALLAGGMIGPWLVPGMPDTFGPATARLGGTLAVAGLLVRLRRDEVWWQGAVIGFVALDLLLFGWSVVPMVDRSLYTEDTASADLLSRGVSSARVYWPTDPVEPSSGYDAEYRVKFAYLTFDGFGPRDAGYWHGMREILLPNTGMLSGVPLANNFDPLLVGWHVDLLEAVVENPTLLRMMGVTHVVSDRPWVSGKWMADLGPRGVSVYRLPDALGRAWIVPTARQVPPEEALAVLADPGFDPTSEVLLETPLPSERRSTSFTGKSQDAPACDWGGMTSGGLGMAVPRGFFLGRSPDHGSGFFTSTGNSDLALWDVFNGVTIRANLDAPGYLVLADTWYPGWQATVDGVPTDLLRANHAFRAVWLEAGEHVVEMVYRPLSVVVGGVVSTVSLVLLVVGTALTRKGAECV